MTTKTLADLVVGDFVTASNRDGIYSIRKITRITKTLIITSDDAKWRRGNGWAPGGHTWDSDYITPTTDEHRVELQHKSLAMYLIRRMSHDCMFGLSTERLQQIKKILEDSQDD